MAKTIEVLNDDALEDLRERMQVLHVPNPDVQKCVAEIIADMRERGDDALLAYTQKFDHIGLTNADLRVTQTEIDDATAACDEELMEALRLAATRIEAYHYRQMPEDLLYADREGIELGWKWSPIDTVGVYVPGGKAAYPSTVLMNTIPARIAGVSRIVMVTPAPHGELNPLVLAAASIAGVEEIYKVGGAQAVAALAYGTGTVPRVDKIAGPGNAYVTEAKRQLYGVVGIDMVAGPSEILVIADAQTNPGWVAADLLSQAEHDADARAILVTDSKEFASAVEKAVTEQLQQSKRREIAEKSWEENGLIVITKDIQDAVRVANRVAPEHLELAVSSPKALLKRVRNAGAVFLGRYTPEAIGDYIAGPSHVLPTGGTARFSSGLSVYDFLTRSSVIGCSDRAFREISEPTELLAKEEGLEAHARSVKIRRGAKVAAE